MPRKQTGTPAWVRLGKLLEERRAELKPEYYRRDVFAAERGVNIRLAQDIENNRRENFTPVTLRDIIACGYGVTFTSLQAVLDSPDADLEAAPDTPPRRRKPPALRAVPAPDPDGEPLPPPLQKLLDVLPAPWLLSVDVDYPRWMDRQEKAARAREAGDDMGVAAWGGPQATPDEHRRILLAWFRWRQDAGSPAGEQGVSGT